MIDEGVPESLLIFNGKMVIVYTVPGNKSVKFNKLDVVVFNSTESISVVGSVIKYAYDETPIPAVNTTLKLVVVIASGIKFCICPGNVVTTTDLELPEPVAFIAHIVIVYDVPMLNPLNDKVVFVGWAGRTVFAGDGLIVYEYLVALCTVNQLIINPVVVNEPGWIFIDDTGAGKVKTVIFVAAPCLPLSTGITLAI